jgi:hypothetical protein
VGVALPRPALEVAWSGSGGTFTINWPTWATTWALSSATNLTPPIFWLPVTNSVSSNDGQFSVTLPLQPGSDFFRLTSP